MSKKTSDELSGGKTPVSLHHLNKDIPLAGATSVVKHPQGKPWLRQLETDRKKTPTKKK
jgi:hypothetical protein